MNPLIEESPHYSLAQALYNLPRLMGVVGNRRRPDILYRSSSTGAPLLYRWDAAMGAAALLTPGEEPVLGVAALHDTQPWLALAQDKGGSENAALHWLNIETGERRVVTEEIGRIWSIHWHTDQSWIVIGSDHNQNYVRHIDADGAQRTLYHPASWVLGNALDAPRRRLILALNRGPSTNYDLAILDLTNGEIEQWLSESDNSRDVSPAVAGETLAYVTNVGGDETIVCRSLLDWREIGRFAVPGDCLELTWADDHTLLAMVAHQALIGPRLLNVRDGQWTPRLSAGSSWSMAATSQGPVWIESSWDKPSALCVRRGDSAETLLSAAPAQHYIGGESHWYPSFDGRRIQGWLLRQPNPNAPLVVYVHGGPTSVTADMWRTDVQALAQAGFQLFAPNYRGSTSFGSEFRDLNIGDVGGGDAQDVLYGARYATQLLGLRTKPAIMGGSYGGYLTLWALTTQPEEWAGGVGFVPVADWVEDYYLLDASFRYYDVHFLGGTPEEEPELYRERSPITHLAQLQAPLLIIHGENDSRCAIQPVIRFTEQARRHNQPVRMVITRDEGHGSVRNVNALRDMVLAPDHLKQIWTT